MSDAEMEETNDTNHEDAPAAPPKERKAKVSPFLKALRDNQIAQAREALMQTVCERHRGETDVVLLYAVLEHMTVEERLVRQESIAGLPGLPGQHGVCVRRTFHQDGAVGRAWNSSRFAAISSGHSRCCR